MKFSSGKMFLDSFFFFFFNQLSEILFLQSKLSREDDIVLNLSLPGPIG